MNVTSCLLLSSYPNDEGISEQEQDCLKASNTSKLSVCFFFIGTASLMDARFSSLGVLLSLRGDPQGYHLISNLLGEPHPPSWL